MGIVLYLTVWGAYELIGPPPCEGWSGKITGIQIYEGKKIECFHGYPVEVK